MDLIALTCRCGMSLVSTSGTMKDRAACLNCDWTAAGEFAEHAGTHHHLDTGHRWTLTIYQR